MITPLDIKKHEFSPKWRGYDPDEVRALLESIAKEFEELNRQNTQLSERLKISEERVNHYRLIEKTLQDAVVTMQEILEEKRKAVEKEADLILQEARLRADAEVQSTREHQATLRAEIHELENQKSQFFIRFKNLLRSQAQMLEAMMESENPADGINEMPRTSTEPPRRMA